ncbi:hypothetical protein RB195_021384 [Necator americanus]|uniref:BPTI/Kunitz inhibitor domain-containing protein n=1 Tax=Necator americanus TaxID=51031 RepID=A0ABR1EAR2_NECAM
MKFVLFLLFCSLILVGNGKRCLLPIQEGPCRALIQRWAYNTTLRSCFEFFYGGCRGNRNNFVDKKGCEQRCEKWKNATNFPTVFISMDDYDD